MGAGLKLAWPAAVAGSKLVIDDAASLGARLLLLSALPVLAGVLLISEVWAGGVGRAEDRLLSLWVIALFSLPPLLMLWVYLSAHGA